MFFLLAGVLVGFVGWIALGAVGFFLLRTGWDAYAAAEPDKAYTFGMLLSRLAIGAVCSIAAGSLATIIAKGNRRAAWWLGGFLLLISMPIHFVSVWTDYPAWYHFAYLLPLMPITGFSGHLILNIENKTKHDQQGAVADAEQRHG